MHGNGGAESMGTPVLSSPSCCEKTFNQEQSIILLLFNCDAESLRFKVAKMSGTLSALQQLQARLVNSGVEDIPVVRKRTTIAIDNYLNLDKAFLHWLLAENCGLKIHLFLSLY